MNLPLIIILSCIALILIFYVLPNFEIAVILYTKLLVRGSRKKWGRECSEVKDKEQMDMYRIGLQWGNEYSACKKEVHIVNDGLNLFGEYFDFGFNKAVLIIAGRSEGCTYSYFYAKPYRESGYNVLVIDNRCNGLSDGKYIGLGLREYKDALMWSKLLHDEFNNEKIIIHGICVGSATALYALTSENCPEYMAGMIADGMYTTFCESFKNHILQRKHPLFPVLNEVMFLIRKFSKVDAENYGPVHCIDKLTKPILFIHSTKDAFSLPQDAQKMYDMCPAEKQIAWFEKGVHSHVRYNNTEEYDRVISEFIGRI